MTIPNRGLLWFLVVGIPLFLICLLGATASLVGWAWLDAKCQEWFNAIEGGGG